jgi:hypothetical protein
MPRGGGPDSDWLHRWRPRHIAILALSLAVLVGGLAATARHGGWVLLPILVSSLLAMKTPFAGHGPVGGYGPSSSSAPSVGTGTSAMGLQAGLTVVLVGLSIAGWATTGTVRLALWAASLVMLLTVLVVPRYLRNRT